MKRLIVICFLLGLILTGCQSPLDDAKADVCARLDKVGEAIEKAQTIDENTPVDRIQEIRQELEDSMVGTEESKNLLERAQYRAMKSVFDELNERIEGIRDKDSLQETIEKLQETIDRLEDAYRKIDTAVCAE